MSGRGVRWAILGTGAIASAFAHALPRSAIGTLRAVGSTSAARAAEFAAQHGDAASGTYDDILGRDDVDAVYIGTVHTTHAALAITALTAGKAVLCEKPAALSSEEAERMFAAARTAGLPLVEAYKYRFSPLAVRARELIEGGSLGRLERVVVQSGFRATERRGRLFDPQLAGGAILDLGGYPVSLAICLARWAGVEGPATMLEAQGHVGSTGVEETASARFVIENVDAEVAVSIVAELPSTATVHGTLGSLDLSAIWGDRARSGTRLTLQRTGHDLMTIDTAVVDPLAAEADAVAAALRDGRTEAPEMPWPQSRDVAEALAAWRSRVVGPRVS